MDLLAAAKFGDVVPAPEGKRNKKPDVNEELLCLVARGFLGIAARQRAAESATFMSYEVHSGDPVVQAARQMGVRNNGLMVQAKTRQSAQK